MKQEYRSNTVTNIHIRKQIKESYLKNIELADTFNTCYCNHQQVEE